MPSAPFELTDSLVRAGAGAGKTTGLVEKIVEVYRRADRHRVPRIVLTTFTRKATQELKERLVLYAVNDKDAGLLQFVSDSTSLHISTIHGLLSLFLKTVGHLAGLDSGFQIISEAEGHQLARLALREVLLQVPENLRWLEAYGFERLLKMVRRYQYQAAEHGDLRPATDEELVCAARQRVDYWREKFMALIDEIGAFPPEPTWAKYAAALTPLVENWGPEWPQVEALPTAPRRSAGSKTREFERLFCGARKIGEAL